MHILKFTQEGSAHEEITVYLEEILNISDSLIDNLTNSYHLVENLLLNDSITAGKIYTPILLLEEFYLSEYLNKTDTLNLSELLYFNDILIDKYNAFFEENVTLSEVINTNLSYSIEIEENVVITNNDKTKYASFVFSEGDITLSWKSRSGNNNVYGYGGYSYGDEVSYGDGNVTDVITHFKVYIYSKKFPSTSFVQVGGVVTITINDLDNPDNDATYTYTTANNISDNGIYVPNLMFKVFQYNADTELLSPASILEVELNYLN